MKQILLGFLTVLMIGCGNTNQNVSLDVAKISNSSSPRRVERHCPLQEYPNLRCSIFFDYCWCERNRNTEDSPVFVPNPDYGNRNSPTGFQPFLTF